MEGGNTGEMNKDYLKDLFINEAKPALKRHSGEGDTGGGTGSVSGGLTEKEIEQIVNEKIANDLRRIEDELENVKDSIGNVGGEGNDCTINLKDGAGNGTIQQTNYTQEGLHNDYKHYTLAYLDCVYTKIIDPITSGSIIQAGSAIANLLQNGAEVSADEIETTMTSKSYEELQRSFYETSSRKLPNSLSILTDIEPNYDSLIALYTDYKKSDSTNWSKKSTAEEVDIFVHDAIDTIFGEYVDGNLEDSPNNVNGTVSTTLGVGNTVHSPFATAAGYGNTVGEKGNPHESAAANAFGYKLLVTGIGTFVSGKYNIAKGESHFVGGGENNIISEGSRSAIIGGEENNISATRSTIINGRNNVIDKGASGSTILGGSNNVINAANSTASGQNNVINSNNSATFGYNLKTSANGYEQFVAGRWNDPKDTALFQVGCGSKDDPKNAIEVLDSGDVGLSDKVVFGDGKAKLENGTLSIDNVKTRNADSISIKSDIKLSGALVSKVDLTIDRPAISGNIYTANNREIGVNADGNFVFNTEKGAVFFNGDIQQGQAYVVYATMSYIGGTPDGVGFAVGTLADGDAKHAMVLWRASDIYVVRMENVGVWGWSGETSVTCSKPHDAATLALVYKDGMYYMFIDGDKVFEWSETAVYNGWGAKIQDMVGTEGSLRVGLANLSSDATFTDWGYSTDADVICTLLNNGVLHTTREVRIKEGILYTDNIQPYKTNSVVVGKYNTARSDAIFQVGNGKKDAPATAFEVLEDGRAKAYGDAIDPEDVVNRGFIVDLPKHLFMSTDKQKDWRDMIGIPIRYKHTLKYNNNGRVEFYCESAKYFNGHELAQQAVANGAYYVDSYNCYHKILGSTIQSDMYYINDTGEVNLLSTSGYMSYTLNKE